MADLDSNEPSSGNKLTAGARFHRALSEESPLQIVGVINAFCARLAEEAGFNSLYLSGAGVANAAFGLPDLGMTSLDEVVEEARRITATTSLPLLVDCDTGWGGALNIARTVQRMEQAGVAAIQLEDQVSAKRCGHRPGKQLVPAEEMQDRIKAALDARNDQKFGIMARTDAAAVEGVESAIQRANSYVECGADYIFAEALTSLEDYARFTNSISVPVLANLTEFGKTPLFTVEEMRDAGINMILYPLTAFRAMNAAARLVYRTIRSEGTQKDLIENLQTRAELYETLNYHQFEQQIDRINASRDSG